MKDKNKLPYKPLTEIQEILEDNSSNKWFDQN